MDTKEKTTIAKQLANISKSFTWNTMRQYQTLKKVILGLVDGTLMEEVNKDWKRLDEDNNGHYMKEFYEAITKLNKKLNIKKNSELYLEQLEKTMFPSKKYFKDVFFDEILQSNYFFMKEKGMLKDMFMGFSGYFKGELVDIYHVGSVTIVETKQKPFSNEKQYHWDEPDEKRFYDMKNQSTVWNSFEDCLFAAMFPQHYPAVQALYEVEQNKDAEN